METSGGARPVGRNVSPNGLEAKALARKKRTPNEPDAQEAESEDYETSALSGDAAPGSVTKWLLGMTGFIAASHVFLLLHMLYIWWTGINSF